MDRPKFAYGVMLPHELKDRFMLPADKMMSARFPIVAMNVTSQPDPTGVHKGTLISNPRDDSDSYANLVFSAHVSWRTGAIETTCWELEYADLFSVDLARAERMVALLRRIRRVREKLPVRPADFGQYIALLGAAVGIEYMVRAEDEATEKRSYYPDGWYRISPVREAQNYVDHLLLGVQERYMSD